MSLPLFLGVLLFAVSAVLPLLLPLGGFETRPYNAFLMAVAFAVSAVVVAFAVYCSLIIDHCSLITDN